MGVRIGHSAITVSWHPLLERMRHGMLLGMLIYEAGKFEYSMRAGLWSLKSYRPKSDLF